MSSQEKGVWIELTVAVAIYATYAVIVLGQVTHSSWATVAYVPLMLGAVAASVVATVVIRTVVAAISPKDAGKRDIRDRQIYRFGEYAGRWAVIAGALGGLVLATLRIEPFWIANEIYVAFFISAVVAGIAKLIGYRRGVPAW